ncbi:hypothetical protein RUND412_008070 [Rhizina undulata]
MLYSDSVSLVLKAASTLCAHAPRPFVVNPMCAITMSAPAETIFAASEAENTYDVQQIQIPRRADHLHFQVVTHLRTRLHEFAPKNEAD